MTTSSFLTTLRQHSSLPLVFRGPAGTLPSDYHLTEVKRVRYETMDCGAAQHDWSENQFELWASSQTDRTPDRGPMVASKFLRIIEQVEATLPLEGEALARIHASCGDQPAALHDIASINVNSGTLTVELTSDRTRCKAAERQVASPAGGCCQSVADEKTTQAGCGCAATPTREAVCCL